MKLSSTAFEHEGLIPTKYACDGESVSIPLDFSDIPEGTLSLTLLMDDPDIPDFAREKFNIEKWDHWVVFNMPPDTTGIPEATTPPGIQGKNTSEKNEYNAPCPPDKEHRYFFRLYALDSMLALQEGATMAEIEKAMEGHILDQTRRIY